MAASRSGGSGGGGQQHAHTAVPALGTLVGSASAPAPASTGKRRLGGRDSRIAAAVAAATAAAAAAAASSAPSSAPHAQRAQQPKSGARFSIAMAPGPSPATAAAAAAVDGRARPPPTGLFAMLGAGMSRVGATIRGSLTSVSATNGRDMDDDDVEGEGEGGDDDRGQHEDAASSSKRRRSVLSTGSDVEVAPNRMATLRLGRR